MRINRFHTLPVASALLFSAVAAGSSAVLAANPPDPISLVSTDACIQAPAGLVGSWRAEGSACDSAGSNHGALVGNTAYGQGKVGQCLAFGGNGDAVNLGTVSNLWLQQFTIEAWVKRASSSVVSFQGDGSGHFFSIGGPGTLAFYYDLNGQLMLDKQWNSRVGAGVTVTDTNWHHVAVTKDGSVVVFYIDGVAHPAPAFDPGFEPASPSAIGGWFYNGEVQNSFYGSIDELSVYSRALSAADIQGLYAADAAGKCSPGVPPAITTQPASQTIIAGNSATFSVSASGSPPLSYQWFKNSSALSGATNSDYFIVHAQLTDSGTYSVVVSNLYGSAASSNAALVVSPPPPCEAPPEGLVSWWRAEDNMLDAAGPNDGFPYYYPVYYSAGKVGRAFSFASSSTCVSVPDAPSLRCTNALTLQAWVNASNYSSFASRAIISKVDYPFGSYWVPLRPPNQNSYFLGITNSGRLLFSLSPNGRTNSLLVSTQALPAGQWSFVAATYDGTAMRLYINGVLAAQKSYSGGIFPGTNSLLIGGAPSGSLAHPTSSFDGAIDEVCLYSRALSDSEMLALYHSDLTGLCQMPLAILQQPDDQAVPLGEDVRFALSLGGTKPFRYQWFFNGQAIYGATNATLLLEKVQTDNAGAYSVVVSNAVGSTLSSNALLSLLPAPACVPPLPGLLGWWPGEANGLDAVSTNNLTVSGPATYEPGKSGYAFSLSTAYLSGGRIAAPSAAPFDFGANDDFSFEAWIKAGFSTNLTRAPGAVPREMYIMSKRYSPGSGVSAQYYPAPGYSLSLTEGRLTFWLNAVPGYGSNATFAVGGPDLRDSMFHHVAVSVQRGATNGGNLYLDGQLLLTFDPTPHQGSLSNAWPFALGSVSGYYSEANFSGLIDEPALYRRALSADEILALRQAGAVGRCKELPSITAQPLSQVVNEGATATFAVSTAGSDNLRYQWRRNGVGLSGATRSSLTLTNVQWANAGSYSVLITCAFGSVLSSNALLTVNHKPAFGWTSRVAFADTNCQANPLLNGAAFDIDGDPVTLNPVPPGPYPLGTNLITLWATDSKGASNACSFQVIVLDKTPPVIVCPPNLVLTNAHDQWTSVAAFAAPVVSDACSSVGQVQCSPPSGTAFGVGVHPVHCFAADSAGNFRHAIFTVTVWPGNVPPEPQIEVLPPARFPGYTNLLVIARDGRQATVTFDGSKSYDLDDTNLFYFWFSGTNLFSTNQVVATRLPVGSHEVALWVDDTFPLGTNAASVTVDVVTPAQSVGILFEMVENSGLPRKALTPLRLSLVFGAAFMENGRTKLALNQLEAFQQNVRLHVTPLNRPLAAKLVSAAQTIIDQCQNKSQPNRK